MKVKVGICLVGAVILTALISTFATPYGKDKEQTAVANNEEQTMLDNKKSILYYKTEIGKRQVI